MPYELTWEERGVLIRFWDVVSDHDLMQSNLDCYDNPRFETAGYEIADFTEATKLAFSSGTLRRVAELDFKASKRNPAMRLAVVGEELLLLGLANMYRALFDLEGGIWEQAQFATVDEARPWCVGGDQRREER